MQVCILWFLCGEASPNYDRCAGGRDAVRVTLQIEVVQVKAMKEVPRIGLSPRCGHRILISVVSCVCRWNQL